jgi:nucleoside-diphosphate-sugar epimerase
VARKYSRILVTGGAGFIGSHLVDRLIAEGSEVTVLDNFDTGKLDNVSGHKDLRIVKGDIRDYALIRRTVEDVDAVFHEAALVSIVLSVQDPLVANEINVTGTLNLLKASSDLGVKRFIYASSAAAYGNTSAPRKKEDMPLDPASPYGMSKLAAEKYAEIFYELYGLETVSLRYFNVYGSRQRFDEKWAYGGVISIFLDRLLKNMPPVIHGDGEQTRDFVYVKDVVEANILALKTSGAAGEVFNIGTGKRNTVNKVAQLLKQMTNKENLENVHADSRPGDVRHGYADISKAERILNYVPKFSIEQGLAELVNWYTQKTKHQKQRMHKTATNSQRRF